jgi:quercetin dioxygenase-like cupin family protein
MILQTIPPQFPSMNQGYVKMVIHGTGGQNAYSSPVHQSATIDYGVLLSGKRTLILDDGQRELLPGDVVVQLANWHGWTNPKDTSLMAFIMMGGVIKPKEEGK